MKNKLLTTIFILTAIFIPSVALAQNVVQVTGRFYDVLRGLIWLVLIVALFWFLWQILVYAFSGKEENRAKARQMMIWGVIALTVMVTVWGLVFLLTQLFFNGQRTDVSLLSNETNKLQQTPVGERTASFGQDNTIQGATGKAVALLSLVIPYMLSTGVLIFIWGVFNYIREENIKKKAAASMFIGWGIILLFIMSFMWVIVIKIGETIQVRPGGTVPTSKVQVDGLIKK